MRGGSIGDLPLVARPRPWRFAGPVRLRGSTPAKRGTLVAVSAWQPKFCLELARGVAADREAQALSLPTRLWV